MRGRLALVFELRGAEFERKMCARCSTIGANIGAVVHGLFIEGARWPTGDEVEETEEIEEEEDDLEEDEEGIEEDVDEIDDPIEELEKVKEVETIWAEVRSSKAGNSYLDVKFKVVDEYYSDLDRCVVYDRDLI